MGLFDSECNNCGSKEHASGDCPHGFFSDNKCSNCGSVEHASDDCPHGFFSGNKCSNCGSVEHASDDCPHGFFSGNKCRNCGSGEHASDDCPHGFFSGNKCSNCGSIEHSSDDCPQGFFATPSAASKTSYSSSSNSSDDGGTSALIWLIAIIAIIAIVVWLAVNIILPVLLLNSALILTISALALKKYRTLFASLSIFGVGYMLLDIEFAWFSQNLVQNVVKDPVWISSFVYINSIAFAISIGILAFPVWVLGQRFLATEKVKSLFISGAFVLLVILGGAIPSLIYNDVFDGLTKKSNQIVPNKTVANEKVIGQTISNGSSKPRELEKPNETNPVVSQEEKRVDIIGVGKVDTISKKSSTEISATINGTDVIIRSDHSTKSKPVGSFKNKGERVEILKTFKSEDETALLLKPLKIRIGNEIVQLEKGKALTVLSGDNGKVKVRFKDKNLNDQIISLSKNSVELVNQSTWYHLKRTNGETGWVFGRFVDLVN